MSIEVSSAFKMSDTGDVQGALAVAELNANLNQVDPDAIKFAIERSKELGNKFFKQKKYPGRLHTAFNKFLLVGSIA